MDAPTSLIENLTAAGTVNQPGPFSMDAFSILTLLTTASPSYSILLLQILLFLLPLTAFSHTVYKDYQTFLSLGPGGTPSTPLGYLKIKLLSLGALRDPYSPPSIPAHFRPQSGFLTSLPKRTGNRPVVLGIAPQRQRSETSSAETYALLSKKMVELTTDPRNSLIERTSCFEKHSTGLFSSDPLTHTCRGEICHAHPSDGSMHLVLHPADAKIVIEAGWAERHPLARGGWFRRFVPREFVMVYAPRNEEEVDVVMDVIAAAVWWVSGVDVKRDSVKEERFVGDSKKEKMNAKACWNCQMKGCKTEKMVAKA